MRALKLAVVLFVALLAAGCEPTADSQAPQVIAFSATWCGPCQRDKPHLHALRDEGFAVTEFDLDRDAATAQQYGIESVPTYIVYDAEGKLVERTRSILRVIELLRWLNSLR
jgi:thioredoxin 1